ncbi:DUF6491 family protein [Emcibacter nanhaiensis]|uniref:Uncharacterized protein n=1 Tax=Emcibacter nanhaiensis TaxID=1505037 RepID=A0A501PRM6_9PROT|nr:DUF6491 family protein [Emcibacter nanhaiensis]TPD63179.1 hypothetical protein FIV46_03635 [Emcibacter nanhaiensis]
MKTKSFILALVLAMGSIAGVAAAAEDGAEKPAAEEPEALAKYERTGDVRKCVPISFIDHTQVLDDQHILFHMKGKKIYLNKLPRRCPRLGFEKSFAYKVSINQLCNVDIITVFDNTSGIPGPSCGLGDFEEVKKKEQPEEGGAQE